MAPIDRQPRICEVHWTCCGTNVLLGRQSRQGDGHPMAIRLNLMGDRRDLFAAKCEETGAVRKVSLERKRIWNLAEGRQIGYFIARLTQAG